MKNNAREILKVNIEETDNKKEYQNILNTSISLEEQKINIVDSLFINTSAFIDIYEDYDASMINRTISFIKNTTPFYIEQNKKILEDIENDANTLEVDKSFLNELINNELEKGEK